MTGRTRALVVALAALGLLGAVSAFAQPTTAPANENVLDVRVSGNKALSTVAVLSYARTRPGQKFDKKLLEDDQQRMLQSGYFESVSAVTDPTDRGIVVTYVVVERPRARINKISLVGVKSLKEKEIRDVLPIKVGGALNDFSLEAGRQEMAKKYRDSGFYFAEVTLDKSKLNDGHVIYKVVEGPRVRIRKLKFEGNTFFNWFDIRSPIKSSARLGPFVDGYLDATGVQDVYFEAEVAVQALLDMRAGKPAPETIRDPGFVIHQGNLKDKAARMWGAKVRQ